MVKCSLCSAKIAELFLGKIKGTIIKKQSSKKQYPVCFDCQKKFKTKDDIITQLK